jgi:hypothetical protein
MTTRGGVNPEHVRKIRQILGVMNAAQKVADVDVATFRCQSASNFRTPHTEKLHVVERFRMIDHGNMLEANIRIEDPGAFTMPWNAVQRWRRVQQGP